MNGFTGFRTVAAEEVPDAVAVMDPFHVVRLAGDALDRCRRRVQLTLHGHRGFKGEPLYSARRTLHTGADLLTDRQQDRLTALFADDDRVEVEATWGIYQRMIAAYPSESVLVLTLEEHPGTRSCLMPAIPIISGDFIPEEKQCCDRQSREWIHP